MPLHRVLRLCEPCISSVRPSVPEQSGVGISDSHLLLVPNWAALAGVSTHLDRLLIYDPMQHDKICMSCVYLQWARCSLTSRLARIT
jgi:hypothetical protein